ncbi:MAG TPA: hypothetical protein VJA94_02020 [Candidatus Angelobacter sp.]
MFRLKTWFWTLSLFFTQTYILCVLWNIVEPKPVYIRMLEIFLPGFKWLTRASFFLGMIESFLYGVYVAVAFVSIHNYFYRKHEPEPSKERQERSKAA